MSSKRLTLLITLFLTFQSVDATNNSQSAIDSLKGAEIKQVVVEDLLPEIEKLGVTSELVKTWVELRLRTAGIIVAGTIGSFLAISITTLPISDFGQQTSRYAISTTVSYYQPVLRLADAYELANMSDTLGYSYAIRKPCASPLSVITWNEGMLQVYGISVFYQEVQKSLNSMLDSFLNDYLKVNPISRPIVNIAPAPLPTTAPSILEQLSTPIRPPRMDDPNSTKPSSTDPWTILRNQ